MILTAPHPAPVTAIHVGNPQADISASTNAIQVTLPTLHRVPPGMNVVINGPVNFFNRTFNYEYSPNADEYAEEGINATYVKGNVTYKAWWYVGQPTFNATVTTYSNTKAIKAGDVVTFSTVYDLYKAKYTLTVADNTQNWQVSVIKPSKLKPTDNVQNVQATYTFGVAASVKQPLPRYLNPVKFWFTPGSWVTIKELPYFLISGNFIYVL